MKKLAAALIGLSAPILGIIVDVYLLHDNYLFSLPITLVAVVFLGIGFLILESYFKGATFWSPTLFTETHNLKRFQEAIRIVDDGNLKWAVVPVGGYQYLKAYLYGKNFNQTKGHVAIMPARLIEAMGSRYHDARVSLIELEETALKELYKLHCFRRVFDSFENFPTKLYLGIASKTLHDDSVHMRATRTNVGGLGKVLAQQEAELGRAAQELDIQLDNKLAKIERAKLKGEIAKQVTRAFDRERDQEQQ